MPATPKPYQVTRASDVDVVRFIQPKIPQPALESLQKELAKRIEEGARKMEVNLEPVAFVDSFGIGVIAATARAIAQKGGALKLCGVNDRVRMSLTITRLDKSLDIQPDEATALRSFGG